MNFVRLLSLAVAALIAAGCSNKPTEQKQAAAPAADPQPPAAQVSPPARAAAPPAPPTPAAAARAGAPSDFPRECADYAGLIDRLKACDKLGGARDGLTRAYDDLRAAWGVVPANRRAEVAAQCKAQADSLRNAVAATCGW